jgi:hypothetical protein
MQALFATKYFHDLYTTTADVKAVPVAKADTVVEAAPAAEATTVVEAADFSDGNTDKGQVAPADSSDGDTKDLQTALQAFFATMEGSKDRAVAAAEVSGLFDNVKRILAEKGFLTKNFSMEGGQEDAVELLFKILATIDIERYSTIPNRDEDKSSTTDWINSKDELDITTHTFDEKNIVGNIGIRSRENFEYSKQHGSDCENIVTDSKPAYSLSLIFNTFSDGDSLGDLIKKTDQGKDIGYKCNVCKQEIEETIKKQTSVWPKTLIVSLGRFVDKNTKDPAKIGIESNIEIKEDVKYKLKAIINHKGQNIRCGHYTAIIRGNNGKWYEQNDDKTYLFADNDEYFDKNIVKIDPNYAQTYTQQAYAFIYEKES